ncbi:MAG: hypothetical protein U0R52_06025 [Solirubrobacterales bacterium]
MVWLVPLAFGDSSTWTPNTPPPGFDPAQAPDAAAITAGIAQQQAQEAAHEQWLDSSAAEQERTASEDAYTDLTTSQSTALLANQFPEQLATLNSDPARILSEADIQKVLGEFAAKVTGPDGQPALLDSSIPIRDPAAGGATEPVDLSLEAQGSGYVPDNGLAYVKLPANSADPIQMAGGLSVDPAVDPAAAHPFGEMNLFYPEVDTDTDMLLSPVTGGIEASDQLRSPDAPEDLSFHLNLPAGAQLQGDGAGGAIVTGPSGQLASVPPPSATDAQGTDVPVAMDVSGSNLQLHVSHQGADLAYPILVDPLIENWQQDSGGLNTQTWTSGKNLQGLDYWFWQTNSQPSPNNYLGSTSCIVTCLGNRGLFSRARTNVNYAPNSYGQWLYQPPGSSSYVSRASFNPIFMDPHTCSQAQPHGYTGIFNYNSWSWPALTTFSSLTLSGWDTGTVGDRYNRFAIAGIGLGNAGLYDPCGRDFVLGGAMLWIEDPDYPSLSVGQPSGWADQSPIRVPVSAADDGLGIRYFSASATNASGQPVAWMTGPANATNATGPCTGLSEAQCPASWDLTSGGTMLNFDPSVLPEGQNTLQVAAWDPIHWPNLTKPVTVNVDHSSPSLDLSGAVADTSVLGPHAYTLHIDARDGTQTSLRSGVRRLVVLVDGTPGFDSGSVPCSGGSCNMVRDWTLDAGSLAEGQHSIAVTAWDGVGKTTSRTLPITVDKTPPDTVIDSGPDGATNQPTIALTYHSTEAGPGFLCKIDSSYEFCSGLLTKTLASGEHTFTIWAVDNAGNLDPTPATRSVNIDTVSPTVTATGPLADAPPSTPISPNSPIAVHVNEPGAGLGKLELVVDGQVNQERSIEDIVDDGGSYNCNNGSCTLTYNLDADLGSDLSNGVHGVAIRISDQAGNAATTPTHQVLLDAGLPEVVLSGSLADADGRSLVSPSGQLNVTAQDGTDSGDTGVARIAVLVDDQTVHTYSSSCSPMCPHTAQSSYTYTKAAFGSGPHNVTVRVIDAVGNESQELLTVDGVPAAVEPPCPTGNPTVEASSGVISVAQAVSNINSAIPGAIAPTVPAPAGSEMEGIDPSVVQGNEPDTLKMEDTIEGGKVVGDRAPDISVAQAVCMQPVSTTAAEANGQVTNGDAIVYANTAAYTDTIVRPTAAGTTVVEELRSSSAPRSFSWRVRLSPTQRIEKLTDGSLAIADSSGIDFAPREVPSLPAGSESSSSIGDVAAQQSVGDRTLVSANNQIDGQIDAVVRVPQVVAPNGSTSSASLSGEGTAVVTATVPSTAWPAKALIVPMIAAPDEIAICAQAFADAPQLYSNGCSNEGDPLETNEPDSQVDPQAEGSVIESMSDDPELSSLVAESEQRINVLARATTSTSYDDLNAAEKAFCTQDFGTAVACAFFNDDKERAEQAQGYLFNVGKTGADNTKANAFRHAFWVAAMVDSAPKDPLALDYSYAHEYDDRTSKKAKFRKRSQMDRLNNITGFKYAHYLSDKDDRHNCEHIRGLVPHANFLGVTVWPFQWAGRHNFHHNELVYRWHRAAYHGIYVGLMPHRSCAGAW